MTTCTRGLWRAARPEGFIYSSLSEKGLEQVRTGRHIVCTYAGDGLRPEASDLSLLHLQVTMGPVSSSWSPSPCTLASRGLQRHVTTEAGEGPGLGPDLTLLKAVLFVGMNLHLPDLRVPCVRPPVDCINASILHLSL